MRLFGGVGIPVAQCPVCVRDPIDSRRGHNGGVVGLTAN